MLCSYSVLVWDSDDFRSVGYTGCIVRRGEISSDSPPGRSCLNRFLILQRTIISSPELIAPLLAGDSCDLTCGTDYLGAPSTVSCPPDAAHLVTVAAGLPTCVPARVAFSKTHGTVPKVSMLAGKTYNSTNTLCKHTNIIFVNQSVVTI